MSVTDTWRKRCGHALRAWTAALLLFLAIPGATQARGDWGLAPNATPAQVDQVIHTLAELPTLQGSYLDVILRRLQFRPPVAERAWADLAEKDKLRIAYDWAAGAGPDNAHAFLQAVAYQLGQRFESLQFDPVFASTFHMAPPPAARIAFRRPPSKAPPPLSPELRGMLEVLAVYVDSPGPLGRVHLAKHRFGLDGNKLEQALARRKPEAFLEMAVRLAPLPPPVYERLNAIMKDVFRHAEAAGHDPRVAVVADKLRRSLHTPPPAALATRAGISAFDAAVAARERNDTPGIFPGILDPGDAAGASPGGSGGSGGGGSPQRMQRAAEWHSRFDSTMYRESSTRTFRHVMARGGGRGGVIAGAEVSSTIGKPLTIAAGLPPNTRCGGPGAQPRGWVAVTTTLGDYRYADLSCDVLSAAYRMTYERIGPMAAWTPGEAIGLASIDTAELAPVFPLFIPEDGNVDRIGLRRRMLLHPALVDLDIGNSVALLDLWPSATARIMEAVGGDRRVLRWLQSFKGKATWKWSDTPMTISARGREIVVRPKDGRSVLAMRQFSREDLQLEELAGAEGFQALTEAVERCRQPGADRDMCREVRSLAKRLIGPDNKARALVTGSDARTLGHASAILATRLPDFARVEELFKVLAVFRWAKAEGAASRGTGIPLAPSRKATPDTVIVGLLQDFIVGAPEPPALSTVQHCRDASAKVQKILARPAADPAAHQRRNIVMKEVFAFLVASCSRETSP